MTNGALSGDGTELAIRKQLLLNKVVEAIVILPRNMFYSTDISVTLWILNNNKKARNVEQNGKLVKYRNRDEQIDFDTKMRQLQTEMRDLLQQEEASKQELKALFEKLGYNIEK